MLGQFCDIQPQGECWCTGIASKVLYNNPLLSGLPDHASPVLNYDQTDHNTEPKEHWCIATVA